MPPARPSRAAPPRGRGSAGGASPPPSRPARAATVYLLLGEEDFVAEQTLRKLLDDLLPASERDLNLDVVDASEVAVRDIIARCETLPFFGNRRVVVLLRGEDLRAPDQDALAAYLEQGPPPSTVIILADRLDRRRRLFGVLQRIGRVIPCDRLDPRDLPGWIRARAKQDGKAMTPEAVEALVALVGGTLRELGSEVDKLAAYSGGRTTITADDVNTVASHVAEATVFDLMDAVGHRQVERALRLLRVVLTTEPPVKVLFMLGDQIRMLLKTKALVRRAAPGRRPSPGDVRDALGTRAFLFARYLAQLEAFGRMDVARMLGLLMETDTEIKTGLKPPGLALETLIVGLCLG